MTFDIDRSPFGRYPDRTPRPIASRVRTSMCTGIAAIAVIARPRIVVIRVVVVIRVRAVPPSVARIVIVVVVISPWTRARDAKNKKKPPPLSIRSIIRTSGVFTFRTSGVFTFRTSGVQSPVDAPRGSRARGARAWRQCATPRARGDARRGRVRARTRRDGRDGRRGDRVGCGGARAGSANSRIHSSRAVHVERVDCTRGTTARGRCVEHRAHTGARRAW